MLIIFQNKGRYSCTRINNHPEYFIEYVSEHCIIRYNNNNII